MKRLAATFLIAAFAIAVSASRRSRRSTPNLAPVSVASTRCRTSPMPTSTAAVSSERTVPDWIWAAFDAMQAVPDRMTFTLRRNGDERVLVATWPHRRTRRRQPARRAANETPPSPKSGSNSPGGDSRVGVEMGHLIRARNNWPSASARAAGCASACSTALPRRGHPQGRTRRGLRRPYVRDSARQGRRGDRCPRPRSTTSSGWAPWVRPSG